MTSEHRTDILKGKFPEVFHKHMGNVTSTCKELNLSRDTYYTWRERDPEFARKCDQAVEIAGDFAESKLFKCINNENVTAILFYLKSKHRDRGYADRMETETKEKVEVKLSENDRDIINDYLSKATITKKGKKNNASS
jgi:hypothetical protein